MLEREFLGGAIRLDRLPGGGHRVEPTGRERAHAALLGAGPDDEDRGGLIEFRIKHRIRTYDEHSTWCNYDMLWI